MFGELKTAIDREDGQALFIGVMVFATLTVAVAISLDFGDAYAERARVQGATDAASIAAAQVLSAGGSTADAIAAAQTFATANGYDDSNPETQVTVNIPPSSGDHTGDYDFAEVIIEHQAEAHFAKTLGFDLWNINGRAVAGGQAGAGAAYGIIALNQTQCQAVSFSGNVSVSLTNAGIFVNSNCQSNALSANGSYDIEAESIRVVGGWDFSGSGTVNPTPSNTGSITDPLADIPEPTPPTSPAQSCPNFGGPPATITLQPGYYDCHFNPNGNKDLVFDPGDYYITDGMTLNGSNDATFGAGVYSFGGVGLRMTGNGTIIANDVTFFIENGELDLGGMGDMYITAPDSGAYAGIAVFQARDNNTEVNLRGTSFAAGAGTIYAFDANIHIVGSSDTLNMQFVSDTFEMDGTAGVIIEWDDNFLADSGIDIHITE